eukprot:4287555-Amphidinium_carterae.1
MRWFPSSITRVCLRLCRRCTRSSRSGGGTVTKPDAVREASTNIAPARLGNAATQQAQSLELHGDCLCAGRKQSQQAMRQTLSVHQIAARACAHKPIQEAYKDLCVFVLFIDVELRVRGYGSKLAPCALAMCNAESFQCSMIVHHPPEPVQREHEIALTPLLHHGILRVAITTHSCLSDVLLVQGMSSDANYPHVRLQIWVEEQAHCVSYSVRAPLSYVLCLLLCLVQSVLSSARCLRGPYGCACSSRATGCSLGMRDGACGGLYALHFSLASLALMGCHVNLFAIPDPAMVLTETQQNERERGPMLIDLGEPALETEPACG